MDALVEEAFKDEPTKPSITHELLTNNDAIIEELAMSSDYKECLDDSSVLCIGAAAISITASRELLIDFLPSYYMSGLQVYTVVPHSQENWNLELAWSFLRNTV